MLRSSCKSFFVHIRQHHPLPRNFWLDQSECAKYFVRLGSRTCLKYLLSLHFYLTPNLAALQPNTSTKSCSHFCTSTAVASISTCSQLPRASARSPRCNTCCNTAARCCSCGRKRARPSCAEAVNGANLTVLQYWHEHGYRWDAYAAMMAAMRRSSECLQYVLAQGVKLHSYNAIQNLAVLQYCVAQGVEWKSRSCADAVQNGDLDMLKWAAEHGAAWGKAVALAIQDGQLDCLKYMREHGAHVALRSITCVGNAATLKYLYGDEETRALLTPHLWQHAAGRGEREMVEYLCTIDLSRPVSLGVQAATSGKFAFFVRCIEELALDTTPLFDEETGRPWTSWRLRCNPVIQTLSSTYSSTAWDRGSEHLRTTCGTASVKGGTDLFRNSSKICYAFWDHIVEV